MFRNSVATITQLYCIHTVLAEWYNLLMFNLSITELSSELTGEIEIVEARPEMLPH